MKLSEKVAIAFIGRLVSGVFSFATGILLARTLTTADFGTYQQAILIVAYVTPLVIFGIDQSVTFFIPRLRDDHEIKTFVFQTTAILFLIGVLASIGLFLSSGWVSGLFHNDHLRSVLAIFALYPIFNLPFSIVALVLYSLDKQKIAATLEAVSSCTQFLVIAILVWFDYALSLLFLTLVIIALIKMIVSLFIFYGCLKDRSPWRVDIALLRNQLRFSAPLGLSKILPIITVNLDKMIVSAFYAVKEFAVYSVGAIELPFIPLITYTMGNVISPKLSRLFYENKKSELVVIWHRMVHKTSLCLYPIFVFSSINAEDIITLLYSDRYQGSIRVFQIYLFLLLVRVSDNAAVIRACNRTPILFKASILVFLSSLILTLVLVKTIGILGPAIGTVISVYVNVFYVIGQLRRPLGLSYGRILPWKHMMKVLILSILCGLPLLPLRYVLTIGFLNLLIKGIVYVVIYLLLTTRLGILEQTDWDLIRKYTGFELIRKISKTLGTAQN